MAHDYHQRDPMSTGIMKGSRNGGIKYGVPKITQNYKITNGEVWVACEVRGIQSAAQLQDPRTC